MKRFAILFLSALLFTHPVIASTPEEIETQIEELEKQKDQIEEQIAELRAQTVEWKHYSDDLVAFDYPEKPYRIRMTSVDNLYRSYTFENPYNKNNDFRIALYNSEFYSEPSEEDGFEVNEMESGKLYRAYDDETGYATEQYLVSPVNDSIVSEIYFRTTDESLPVYRKLFGSIYDSADKIKPDTLKIDDDADTTIQENYYFTEDEEEDINAVIMMAEKYLNMEVTKDQVRERISNYHGRHVFSEAFDIAIAMINGEDQKIRQRVRDLKFKLENQLPDK